METNIKQANAVFIQRYATAQEWTANNPQIFPGEIGIESNTGKIKVGGVTASNWNELDYVSSDGGQTIDNLDTIYEDPSELPNSGNYEGKQLVAKNGGRLPLNIYRWVSSTSQWVSVGLVKETVVYFVKRKDNATNILCFYDQRSSAFVSTEQQKHLTITTLDTIIYGVENLNEIQSKENGDTYVVLDYSLNLFCLYQYQSDVNNWVFLAPVNDQAIYSNARASNTYSAPENSLWKVNIIGTTINFVRLGYDADLAAQIEDISSSLTELYKYVQAIVGGSVEDLSGILTEQEDLIVELKAALIDKDPSGNSDL